MHELARDDGFIARCAELADAPAILNVVQAAFPAWPLVPIDVDPLEHLEWKMTPPGGDVRYHTVVTLDGDVVASKLRWVGRAQLRGDEYATASGADFAVKPAYQGRGLGRMIVDWERTGDRARGELAFDLAATNEIIRNSLGRKGKLRRPLRVWSRPLSPRSFVSVQLRSGGPTRLMRAAAAAAHRASLGASRDDEPTALQVVELEQFDQRTDALWSEVRGQFDFARTRDSTFLNWRYADPRAGRATILCAIEDDEARAYAVVRPARRSLNLADMLVHPGHPAAGVAVLRRAAALDRARGASSIIAWLPPAHPDEAALTAVGFVATRATMVNEYFTPRGPEDSSGLLEPFTDPSLREHITIGDFDFA